MPTPSKKFVPRQAYGGDEIVPEKISPNLLPLAVPITSLSFDPDNARLHPERSIEVIMASLSEFGQMKSIVVRKETMTVVAGNGTLEAATRLGWKRIAANVESMTEEQAMAYGLADNRTAEESHWNIEVVQRQTALLEEFGSSPLGWSEDELLMLRQNEFTPVPSDEQEGAQTWQDLWQGMPEFIQDDMTSYRHVVVHFRNEEDFLTFLALVEQEPGDVKQKSIWFPKAEIGRFADKRYVANEEEEDANE